MDKRQRVSMQRALVREAIGKLRAAVEFFGIEDGAVAGVEPDFSEFKAFEARVDQFEEYVFTESPIA